MTWYATQLLFYIKEATKLFYMHITVKVYEVLGNLEGMGQFWAFNGQEESKQHSLEYRCNIRLQGPLVY